MATINSYNHNVVKFNEQKSSWENAIHLYKGPDPLEYWYHYVNWYEQNYCYDNTNKMPDLLQKVLSQFNNINAYKQDHRMVKVWLKYVDLQQNPLNIFQNLYQRGVGTQLSFFYIAWANCYLKENDFKLAESAINWGFQAQAKPLEDLQSAQQQVANSYFEFTQQQRPGPYQIVVRQQSTSHQQPPLPAQVATNYQNPSYVRDKRKLEDTFPVHNSGGQGAAKRSRPNEGVEYNGQYAANSGYQSPVAHPYNHQHGDGVNHHPKAVTYPNNNCNNYAPPTSHGYIQHGHGEMNGKANNVLPGTVYQQHPQTQYTTPQQNHNPVQTFHHQPQQQQMHHAQQISAQHQGHYTLQTAGVVYPQSYANGSGGAPPPATIGYNESDCNNGYPIASSLNYVYEDYHQGAAGGVEIIEESAGLPPHQQQQQQQQQQLVQEQYDNDELGIQLPPNFARSATNSNNIWRAPLYLEEPYNPNQRPMYIKDQVYPLRGNEASGRCEYEYSFEELRRSARRAAAEQAKNLIVHEENVATIVETDDNTYEEYWTEEVTVQPSDLEYNQQSHIVNESAYGEFVPEQSDSNCGSVYYHVMEPKASSVYGEVVAREARKSSKKKSKHRKKMIVQINDTEEDEDEDSNEVGGEQETTTIRYTCDQNGLSGGEGQAGGADMRRITIKLRKQAPNTPTVSGPSSATTTTPKVPYGNGTGVYRRTATDADADLLLSLGNGQSGYYQELKGEDSSEYASYNSSYLGDNSNSGFTSAPATAPSTPVHSFQHGGSRLASISATSTPQLTPAYRRLTKHRSNVSIMNDDSMNSTLNENSFYQGELDEEVKSRRLARAVAVVDDHFGRASIDPFNAELCKALLTKIGFPSPELCDVYRMVQTPLPKLSNAKQAMLGDTYYNVEKEVGRGTYGAVYKATNVYSGAVVAIKFQKPANSWELYICNEIKKRIKYHDILPGFMDITSAVLAPNGCVLISEFSPYGSLLDINNKIRLATTRVMHESLVMHFTTQILDIIHYLHECRIVHADIKPDNFLIMKAPNSSSHVPTVRLIDFGCAIDMDLFPEDTQFKKVIQTEGFTCTEMKENKPWTYQTDLYCVAATVHVMLFGEYMQVSKKFGGWEIKQKLPRYLKKNAWTEFFNKLLNVPNCNELPNLLELKEVIDNEAYAMESELQKHIRTLTNLLFRR